MPTCEIRCERCSQWFPSPVHFGSSESFFTSALIGNKVKCRHCGLMSGCNKDNMRFRDDDKKGFVGNKT